MPDLSKQDIAKQQQESKQKVMELAKGFFSQAIKQAPALLAHRLGLDSDQYTDQLGKAAAFWFASQKLYLYSKDEHKASQAASQKAEHKQTKYKDKYKDIHRQDGLYGVIDLVRRCLESIDRQELAIPHRSKIEALSAKAMQELQEFQANLEEIQPAAALEEDLDQLFDHFLQAREAFLASKLQYLPDSKLIRLLGFESHQSFTLNDAYRYGLQRFLHLQTLFDSVKPHPESDAAVTAYKILCVELKELLGIQGDIEYLADAYFVRIAILLLRVVEWGAPFSMEASLGTLAKNYALTSLPLEKMIILCFKIGFIAAPEKSKLIVTLATRGFYIGQGLLLASEHGSQEVWQHFNLYYEAGFVDYPAICRMTSDQRLLVTMPKELPVAQVAISSTMLETLHRALKICWLEYFEVPEDRKSFKISQVRQLQTALLNNTDLNQSTRLAQQLFMALAEMGPDWPEMFPFMTGIKNLLRQKNLKLVWFDENPYWTLMLRSKSAQSATRQPFPRADQVSKLLKRFDF